jgi:pimeloyl-ACP methyl ester carboxylesterase
MTSAEAYLDEQSRYVTIDGLRVHHKREGAGPPVLLLHGSGSTLHSFDAVAADLISDCEVVRLDLPGFGLTGPRLDRDYRIETFVEFLTAFMAELGLTDAHVVGHSLGGNIAWNLAVEHPPRVRSLVLLNATGYPAKTLPAALRMARNPVLRPLLRRWAPPRGATVRGLRASVGPGMTVEGAMVERISAMLSRPGNRSAFIDFANTDQTDRSRRIPGITAPTLIVRSDLVDGQLFSRDIPNSREIELPGVGHLMPEEAPRQVAAAIRTQVGLPLSGAADGNRR